MATITAQSQVQGLNDVQSPLLQKCRDYYKISTEQYKETLLEGFETIDLYHNRQYTAAQLAVLAENGQPAETFNIIKMFSNVLIGYMETVVTQATAEPRYPAAANVSLVMNDVLQYTYDENEWETTEKYTRLDGILTGLMAVEEQVVPTGLKDQFGREINEIKVKHLPSWQVRVDPQSNLDDYSDGRFIHHAKWMPEEGINKAFGSKKLGQLTEYYNFLESDASADWAKTYTQGFDDGYFKQYNNYLVVKTCIYYRNKFWSVIWSDNVILEKKEITFRDVRFPIRITKMTKSDRAEYYGPFREVVETQKAINQALIQIQLLVNTSKAFVEEGSVEDFEEFRELFGRINAVIPVLSLQGVKIENMSRDIQAQYTIIDNALTRVKLVLGINDSFLGNAYASDSGRKVQIQQQSSSAQLTMVVDRSRVFFKLIAEDIVDLAKQYYRGTQILKIADPLNAYHYVEINVPLMMPTGEMTPDGQVAKQPMAVPSEDPETGEIEYDDEGNVIMIPLNTPESDIEFADVDINVTATRSDNASEKNQVLFETFVNGPAGQAILQINPAAYFRTMAMQVSEMGTKHSIEIAKLLMDTAIGIEQGSVDPRLAMVGGDVQAIMGAAMGGSTGSAQNAPQGNTGQSPGNTGGIPSTTAQGGM